MNNDIKCLPPSHPKYLKRLNRRIAEALCLPKHSFDDNYKLKFKSTAAIIYKHLAEQNTRRNEHVNATIMEIMQQKELFVQRKLGKPK